MGEAIVLVSGLFGMVVATIVGAYIIIRMTLRETR